MSNGVKNGSVLPQTDPFLILQVTVCTPDGEVVGSLQSLVRTRERLYRDGFSSFNVHSHHRAYAELVADASAAVNVVAALMAPLRWFHPSAYMPTLPVEDVLLGEEADDGSSSDPTP